MAQSYITMKVLTGSLNLAILTLAFGVAASAADNGIAWDATAKSVDAANGQDSARFVFTFTNVATKDNSVQVTNYTCATNYVIYKNTSFWKIASGDKYTSVPQLVTNIEVTTVGGGVKPAPVTILSVQPSSGCKTADLPSQPWVLSPGATGEIQATVDLAGQNGTVVKTVVVNTDHGRTELTLRVNLAASPATQVAAQSGASQSYRASWAFDQSSGNVVADASGNGNNATVVGGDPNWVKASNPDGSGLKLDGASFAEAPSAAVDTTKSFTVSARVSLDAIESKKYQTFVSIDGQDLSGFYLQMNPYAGGGTGRFEFDRMASDAKGAAKIVAKAKPAIAKNTWYQLVGVYDAEAQNISLYLNGKLQETASYPGAWQASGKTAIGRGRVSGHDANYMTGVIRDVRFYGYALTAAQVKEMAE